LRLIGVSLTDVSREGNEQLSIFGNEKRSKARAVDKAVDKIRGKYGSDTIVRGSSYKSELNVGKKHKAQLDEKK
jgi:DNA polymerase-4